MGEKLYLGKVREDSRVGDLKDMGDLEGERLWITKHSFDCGWYWGFGYIGNRNRHTHFDHGFLGGAPCTASTIFEEPQFTDNEWWVIRDLMIQAYALKAAAAVYRHGGHQTTREGITDVIRSRQWADCTNNDLEKVLDTVWQFMGGCIGNQTVIKDAIAKEEKHLENIKEKMDELSSVHAKNVKETKAKIRKLKAKLKD